MGDRFDAKYLKDVDAMHFIMPFMYPNRCDNEAFFSCDGQVQQTAQMDFKTDCIHDLLDGEKRQNSVL